MINSATPSSGQFGTRVTLVGTDLLCGGSSITSVMLAGVAAMVESVSNTSIVCVAQNGTAGVGNISIAADTGGTAIMANGWTQLVQGIVFSLNAFMYGHIE